jgi:hypothetical protein
MIHAENFKRAMVQKILMPEGPGVTRLSHEIGVNKCFTIGEINFKIWQQEAQYVLEGLTYHKHP